MSQALSMSVTARAEARSRRCGVLLGAVLLLGAATGALANDPARPAPAARAAAPAKSVSAAATAQPAVRTEASRARSHSASLADRPLDLAPPPIALVMTREQVQSLVVEHEHEDEPTEDVTVASDYYREPVPQGQFPALAWALTHPLQAWRIFTPVTDQ